MPTADEYKSRIAKILDDRPWEHSKTALQKAERERKAMVREKRQAARAAKAVAQNKPPPRPHEWWEQQQLCEWLTKRKVSFFAPSPEIGGEDADPVRMSQFKSIGWKSGVPDIIIVDLANDGRPIALEMKRTKLTMSSLTKPQRRWKEIFLAKGWHYGVGFGHVEAIQWLKSLGIGDKR